jgi:hypothetical protein
VFVPTAGVVQSAAVRDLIALAPEMAAALKALLPPNGEPGVGEWWGGSEDERRERIRAVLAKLPGGAA